MIEQHEPAYTSRSAVFCAANGAWLSGPAILNSTRGDMQCLTHRLIADALRQYLAGTKPVPSELRDLLVKYHTSFDAVKALLDHTNGTVQLLAAVFAGWEEVMYILRRRPEYQQSADEFDDQVTPWLLAQYKGVTGPDLLAVLPSAQTVPPDPPKHLLDRIATWFLENVPLPVLTDEVVAEMSIWMDSYPGPSPELGAGWPPENRNTGNVGCWLISRYLYNRFGEHGPSWDVFVKLYDTEFMSIGVAADEGRRVAQPVRQTWPVVESAPGVDCLTGVVDPRRRRPGRVSAHPVRH